MSPATWFAWLSAVLAVQSPLALQTWPMTMALRSLCAWNPSTSIMAVVTWAARARAASSRFHAGAKRAASRCQFLPAPVCGATAHRQSVSAGSTAVSGTRGTASLDGWTSCAANCTAALARSCAIAASTAEKSALSGAVTMSRLNAGMPPTTGVPAACSSAFASATVVSGANPSRIFVRDASTASPGCTEMSPGSTGGRPMFGTWSLARSPSGPARPPRAPCNVPFSDGDVAEAYVCVPGTESAML